MQRQNTDGSVADFTEWDSFEIGIIEGCGGGKIMAGDSLDSYFSEAYLPIYFVADSTLTDTSITVGIRAGLIEGIIGASRMQNNNGQQEEKSDNKKNKRTVSKPVNKTNTQNTPQNNPAASCFGGAIEKNIVGNGNVVVGNLEIILIRNNPPPYKNDVFITEDPKMPEIVCKAKLNQDYQGTIQYEWKFIVRQEYQRKGKVPPLY